MVDFTPSMKRSRKSTPGNSKRRRKSSPEGTSQQDQKKGPGEGENFALGVPSSFPEATLLALIPSDLFPLIQFHWIHHQKTNNPKLRESYKFERSFGSSGGNPSSFRGPRGIAIHYFTGEIYIADAFNHRIQVFDCDGEFIRCFGYQGVGLGEFNIPTALTFDLEGNLVVVDEANHRVQSFDLEGNFKLSWGGLGLADGELHSPRGITTANDGNIIIC